MLPVKGQHVRVDLGGHDTAVARQLADELQSPTVQEQVDRKAVPKGVASDLERRLSPPTCSIKRSMFALTAWHVIGKIRSSFRNFPIHR